MGWLVKLELIYNELRSFIQVSIEYYRHVSSFEKHFQQVFTTTNASTRLASINDMNPWSIYT